MKQRSQKILHLQLRWCRHLLRRLSLKAQQNFLSKKLANSKRYPRRFRKPKTENRSSSIQWSISRRDTQFLASRSSSIHNSARILKIFSNMTPVPFEKARNTTKQKGFQSGGRSRRMVPKLFLGLNRMSKRYPN